MMKWTENGVSFEGTPAEYKELHADGFQQIPTRTRSGRHVTVYDNDASRCFDSVKNAAEWISQQTGRYVSASALGKMLNENNFVNLDRFKNSASLFESINKSEGE